MARKEPTVRTLIQSRRPYQLCESIFVNPFHFSYFLLALHNYFLSIFFSLYSVWSEDWLRVKALVLVVLAVKNRPFRMRDSFCISRIFDPIVLFVSRFKLCIHSFHFYKRTLSRHKNFSDFCHYSYVVQFTPVISFVVSIQTWFSNLNISLHYIQQRLHLLKCAKITFFEVCCVPPPTRLLNALKEFQSAKWRSIYFSRYYFLFSDHWECNCVRLVSIRRIELLNK